MADIVKIGEMNFIIDSTFDASGQKQDLLNVLRYLSYIPELQKALTGLSMYSANPTTLIKMSSDPSPAYITYAAPSVAEGGDGRISKGGHGG